MNVRTAHCLAPAGNACRTALLALAFCTATPAAGAATGSPAAVTHYGATEVLGAMYGASPKPHWLPGGKLGYRALVEGKPEARVFDPAADTVSAPVGPPSKRARPRVLGPGLMSYSPPIRELPSPDGEWFAGTRAGNLRLRPAEPNKKPIVLTRDGNQTDGYTVLGARWSPDGRYLAARRMDYRGVPSIPLVDWKDAGEPVKRWPYSRAGEPIVRQRLVIVDRDSGKVNSVSLEKRLVYLHPVSWSPDSRYLYLMATTRLMKRLELIRVDARTGKAAVLLTEKSRTNIDGSQSYLFVRGYAPQLTSLHYVTVLADGRFVWTSARDGWRRLYLYAPDGKPIRPLTPARQPVVRVVGLDPAHGLLYYVGQAKRGRPYENALFAVPLGKGAPREVVYGPRFHQIRLRRDGRYVAAFHGGLDAAPTLDVYDAAGKHLKRLWSAASIFSHFPTQPPEPVVVKAADGKTPLYGMVFKPHGFDPARRYPVVEIIYGGPQDHIVARWQAGPDYWSAQALANEGFAVVEVDARGTPGRGKAFADAFHGRIGQGEIADHVAALRQIAAQRPWMDMRRVGVVGHSWGGYFAARALLTAPDVYKAGVASAGPASLRDFRVPIEPYMGCLPKQCPDAYDKGSNAALAGRLEGHLMIMQGTADRDVPFGESMRLIAALEKAHKPYQYVAFPGSAHTIYYNSYWWHRIVRYFRHTLGTAEPGAR